MPPPVPVIEVGDDRNPLRTRRPYREMRSGDTFMFDHMGAQGPPEPQMRALSEKMQVELTQNGAEPVGIVALP